jgi:Holliday junction resolvase YEN1
MRPLTYMRYSPSATLSGNKSHHNVNALGKRDGLHTTIYRDEDIFEHPSIQLCQGGLILFALLGGGDYHTAELKGCGRGIAHALPRPFSAR